VTRRRVLALRALDEAAGDGGSAGLRWTTLERLDVAEPERLQIRQVQPTDSSRDVPVGVRALVSLFLGVR
jgi:hypothetical protein